MTNWTPRASNRLGAPDAPTILAFSFGEGVLHVTLGTTAGRSYIVEYSDDLSAAVWTPLGPPHPATGSALALDLNVGPQPQRFFRIRLQ